MKGFCFPSLSSPWTLLDHLHGLYDHLPGLKDHSRGVAATTLRLAQAMGIAGQELVSIFQGAMLHDVGKAALPAEILNKAGPLSDAEWDIVRLHPVYGLGFLAKIPALQPAAGIPFSHHERWDGSGYPLGFKDKEIPLFARICAVVDVWDALTQDRPYRKAWSEAQARSYLYSLSGSQFDERVVEKFLQVIPEKRV